MTMKTQISRSSFRPRQHYSGVQLQQGRMIVDADWNEQSEILDQRLVGALGDLLVSGAPKKGGLSLKVDGPQLLALPGRLYVEGVAAALDGPTAGVSLTAQPDYPNPPSLPAGNLRVYADVWERSVTALEDPELMDPGLHGADTASRSRTMLQLKWCDAGIDPQSASNPRIGDAPLSLRLRSVAQAGDLCDPCAAEVDIDRRVGNYLFRVEVHDVYLQAGKKRIVLKWSRDNGAEAYAATAVPPGFDQGRWTWEFFDSATEKQLGNHFPTSFRPRRGVLVQSFQAPVAAGAPKAFVRRWDGQAEIDADSLALIGGSDRGATLRTDGDAQAAGRVTFAAGAVTINLDLLELTLGLTGKAFVAGDYWLGAVREAVHRSGDATASRVLDQALPSGVLHHCLELGRREAGVLLPPAALTADALRRRMSFPPLTALEAGDVAYQPPASCLGLYKTDASGAVENVRQALDRLCGLGAEQVGFTLANPLPPNSVASLLAAQLGAAWPNLDGVEKNPAVADMLQALLYRANAAAMPYTVPACAGTPGTVGKLLGLAPGAGQVGTTLDRLLCNLGADQLPLGTPSCPDLAASGATTVLDALDYLCGTRLTRCSVTVPLGALQAQLQDFAARPELTDLWLCLLPGEHVIDGALSISGKRSLRVTAAAAAATTVFFRSAPATFSAQELGLEGVRLRFASAARLTLRGNRIVAERNVFVRSSAVEKLPPMVRLEALGADSELVWRDNVMQDTWSRGSNQGPSFFGPAVIGNARVAKAFEDLLGDTSLVEDDARFESRLKVVADELAGMSGTERLQWRNRLAAARGAAAPRALAGAGTLRLERPLITALEGSSVGLQSKVGVGALTVDEARPIASTAIDHINAVGNDSAAIAGIVRDELVLLLFESGYNTAFALAATDLSGSLTDNHFDGEVLLANGQGDGVDPRDAPLENFVVSNDQPFVNGRGRLACSGNRIQRLYMWVPRAQVVDNLVGGTVPGYESVTLSANHFGDRGNSVFASTLIVTGNHVAESGVDTTARLGLTLSQRTSYTGNVAASSGTGAPNWRAIARVRAITGNLMNVIL